MMKILLVDDSLEVGRLVEAGLITYSVVRTTSISEARSALDADSFALVLIDVDLPDGSGFDFCHQLARDPRFGRLPKILLTAKDQASEKIYGFTCGAEDYVTKPFNMLELQARIDRYLRRGDRRSETQVHGVFEFSVEFQKCYLLSDSKKTDLGLTPTEFRLMFAMIQNEGRLFTRKMLENVGWASQGICIESRGIDTHIAHLRKKLGGLRKCIVSVYGQGYTYTAKF